MSGGRVLDLRSRVVHDLLKELRDTNGTILELVAELRRASGDSGRNITVTHTQAGNMGFYGGVAVTACVATVTLMIAFMIIENRSYSHLDNQVDQLRAWSDVHSKEISRLQAQMQEKH
jgi:hypothetical protein